MSSLCFTVSVESTRSALLAQEDTDGDGKITIYDQGPKAFVLHMRHRDGLLSKVIRGTSMLANLLEELTLAADRGETTARIPFSKLFVNPVEKLAERIKTMFWRSLTRRLDSSRIAIAAKDPKDWMKESRLRIYVPSEETEQYSYYKKISQEQPELDLEVIKLPPAPLSPDFIKSLNDRPGILALEMTDRNDLSSAVEKSMRGCAFVVPGGRFNELYYWDSYFSCIGLLHAKETSLVADVLKNFNFQIRHYGKILNANRSYYLGRSQPPFLTDLARRLYQDSPSSERSKQNLRETILCAIKEYATVWMAAPRINAATGLSHYRPLEKGFPPEVEDGQFDHIIVPLAAAHGCTVKKYIEQYDNGQIINHELDEFLLHDRSVRESGHDVSYRLEGRSGHLLTIDLNCLLYKYETDIAWAIQEVFDNDVDLGDLGENPLFSGCHHASAWLDKAAKRKQAIDQYLWNATEGIYFDYNVNTQSQTFYESATCFYALWCGVASEEQALKLVQRALPKLEQIGGLSSTTLASRGELTAQHPQRQWDYPFGWAPHQMLAWDGLLRYGYEEEAHRLIYRWLHMVTHVSQNLNGAIVEKYNVTSLDEAHMVDAEYGNQGLDFKGLTREGFGWTNASYVYGLSKLPLDLRSALEFDFHYEPVKTHL